MNQESLLTRDARRSAAIEDLEIVNPVESRITQDRGPALIVAATVDHVLLP
jgi:hypothetical protein